MFSRAISTHKKQKNKREANRMIGRRTYIALGALALIFTGCIPDEDPITPYDRGDAVQSVVEMGSDYRYQSYFDVETNSVVKSNLITDWDLGFRCDAAGNHIVLNDAKIMAAADLGAVDFTAVPTTGGLSWKYDRPSGEWDSTAIGEWWRWEGEKIISKNHVYVLDRGYGPDGKALGYAKMMILSATDASYTVRTATLNNSNDRTVEIPRDTTRNIVGLSFDGTNPVVDVEPPKEEWDLLFTRYTHVFYAPEFTPYSVTGILLNRYNTVAVADTTNTFGDITAAQAATHEYSRKLDAIGYDWKTYDLTQGFYTVDSPVYILQDSKGFLYKLQLLDFYSQTGEKGYPRIESQKL